jgi:hypothetical protein
MASLVLLGTKTLGEFVPLALAAQGALDATLGATLPEIQAKIQVLLDVTAQLTVTPPSLAASLDAVLDMVTGLEGAIAAGVPDAALNLDGLAAALADLQATLDTLNVQATFNASFLATLGTPGVTAYRYDGTPEQLAQAASSLSGSTQHVGILLLASDAGAITAVEALFGL